MYFFLLLTLGMKFTVQRRDGFQLFTDLNMCFIRGYHTSTPNKSKPMVKAITLRCSAEVKHKSKGKLSEMNESKLIV